MLSSREIEQLEMFQRNKDLEFWHSANYKEGVISCL